MARPRKGPQVPKQFSSGPAYKAYKRGYALAQEPTPSDPAEARDRFDMERRLSWAINSWNSTVAFDAGFEAGKKDLLTPPTGTPIDMPPPQ